MLWFFAAILAAVLIYVFVLRAKVKAIFPSFFAWLEPIEATLWAKSRTVLAARLTWLGGLIAGIANLTAGVDWSTLLGQLVSYLPASIQPTASALIVPLAVTCLGGLFDWLRHVTSEPLAAKE